MVMQKLQTPETRRGPIIINLQRHAEWYVILKHVLGPLGREFVWEGSGVTCNLNSDGTNTFWVNGNHEIIKLS